MDSLSELPDLCLIFDGMNVLCLRHAWVEVGSISGQLTHHTHTHTHVYDPLKCQASVNRLLNQGLSSSAASSSTGMGFFMSEYLVLLVKMSHCRNKCISCMNLKPHGFCLLAYWHTHISVYGLEDTPSVVCVLQTWPAVGMQCMMGHAVTEQ